MTRFRGASDPDEWDGAYIDAADYEGLARDQWEADFRTRYRAEHPRATEAEIDAALADEIDAMEDNDPRSMGWVDDRGLP